MCISCIFCTYCIFTTQILVLYKYYRYLIGKALHFRTFCVWPNTSCVCIYICIYSKVLYSQYWVATVSRIDKIIGLFCKRVL